MVWLKQNFDLVTIMTEAFGILQKMVILWQFSFKSLEKSLQSITSRFPTSARACLINIGFGLKVAIRSGSSRGNGRGNGRENGRGKGRGSRCESKCNGVRVGK